MKILNLYAGIEGGIMKDDYRYETVSERYSPIDFLLDTPRIRLFKSYHKLDSILDTMDEALKRASDYPEDLTKDDANLVQEFLEDLGEVLQRYDDLFNKFDE